MIDLSAFQFAPLSRFAHSLNRISNLFSRCALKCAVNRFRFVQTYVYCFPKIIFAIKSFKIMSFPDPYLLKKNSVVPILIHPNRSRKLNQLII